MAPPELQFSNPEDNSLLSEQRELAFETVPLGWWSYDIQSGTVYWDERVREMFDVTNPEQAYEDVLERIHPDDRGYVAESVAAALDPANTSPYAVEYRLIRPNGDIRWISSRGKTKFEGEGPDRRPIRFAGTALDITSTKVAELALHESEARFRFLSDLGEQTRAQMDPDDVMEAIVGMLGAHLNVSCCAYADVEDDGNTFTIHRDYTDGIESIRGTHRLSDFGQDVSDRMHGGSTWIMRDVAREIPAGPVRDAFLSLAMSASICQPLLKAGRLVAMIAVHQSTPRNWTDSEIQLLEVVTERAWATLERARVTRELVRREANFRELADAMPQMIFVADETGHVNYFNRKWYEYTGLPDGSVGYEYWKDTHDPATLPHVVEEWTHAVATGEPYEIEYRLRRADGEWRWHLGRALPVREPDGRIVRWFGTNTDIHEKKQLEEQIRHLLESERFARHEAERQERIKDEFLATLSHELRTPLNAIIGWSDLLEHAPSHDDIAKGIEVIGRNARTQAQIIEDLLDLSRIISGRLRLEMREVCPAQILHESVDTVRSAADSKGVELDIRISDESIRIVADSNRLQQVFWNLLNNAIKFTPKGGFVRAELENAGSHLIVRISDSGIGIRPDFLPLIFDRFQQADPSTTRSFGGLGIGLSIVRQLVELHGGDVTAASDGLEKGARFTVNLPIRAFAPAGIAEGNGATHSPASHPTVDYGISLEGLTLLLVDDQKDSREFVEKLLGERKAIVVAVDSADAALETLESVKPSAIVSDIAMPGTDGYQLIRRIRERETPDGTPIPALALTAYARPADRAAALEAGFQEHVSKPVHAPELVNAIARLTGRLS